MKILLCNDDGYRALGINTLAETLIDAGHDVTIVAPHEERSGQSHAVSFFRPFVVQRVAEKIYSVHGTPADCAIVGLKILESNKPDVVISGINHGLNVGWDVNYSGTVGAATEATLLGYPAIATSVDLFDRKDRKEAFQLCATFVTEVLKNFNTIEWPRFEVLNINHPGFAPKGVSVARCNGVTLYAPACETLPSQNIPLKDVSVYLIGGSERVECSEEGEDVQLIQSGHVTLSFVQCRQSSTINTQKLSGLISRLR